MCSEVRVRAAHTGDIPEVFRLMEPLVASRVILGKDLAVLYAAVPEFMVAETGAGEIVGCGALHVFWEDLGEIRTLIVAEPWQSRGVGRQLVEKLESHALGLGMRRLFCLTFATGFFGRLGFQSIGEEVAVSDAVYRELLLSPDEGVAEFLNLSRVKPNTLGNTRMLKLL